jgi:hypothetical protein
MVWTNRKTEIKKPTSTTFWVKVFVKSLVLLVTFQRRAQNLEEFLIVLKRFKRKPRQLVECCRILRTLDPIDIYDSFNFFSRDPNNNIIDDAASPKLHLVTRHGGLDGLKQNGLTHVDFPCLPPSHTHQPSIKLESHGMQMLVANSHHDAMLAQNVAEFAQCLPDTHMLNTLTPSLVGLWLKKLTSP